MFDNQTYLTGTVRATRKNMPKSFRNMKLQKGERVVRQSGAIMALKYGDRKTVWFSFSCKINLIKPHVKITRFFLLGGGGQEKYIF
jgi:hypothetical protein